MGNLTGGQTPPGAFAPCRAPGQPWPGVGNVTALDALDLCQVPDTRGGRRNHRERAHGLIKAGNQ